MFGLEPADFNRRKFLKAVFEWDVLNWSRATALWEQVLHRQPGQDQMALEIGSRNGGLSLYLARREFQVLCTDVECPKQTAQPHHRLHRVDHLISYGAANIISLPFASDSFDVVALKSVLGAVGRNGGDAQIRAAVNEVWRILRPGGALIFAENLVGSRIHMFLRRRFVPWGSSWNYASIAQMQEYLARFSEIRYETFGVLATFGRTERQREIIHHVDRVISPLIPARHHYIIYGFARK